MKRIISILCCLLILCGVFLLGFKDSKKQVFFSWGVPGEIHHLLNSYGAWHWQYPDSIDQLIDYASRIDDPFYLREVGPSIQYLKNNKDKGRYVYFKIKDDIAVYLSRDNGYAIGESIHNPCDIENNYDTETEMGLIDMLRKQRNIAMRKILLDASGNLIDYSEDYMDTVFHHMSVEIGKAFPAEEYNYVYHACMYDCLTGELINYCTGEAIPDETANIVKPYLEQIKSECPSVVQMKFYRKLAVRK